MKNQQESIPAMNSVEMSEKETAWNETAERIEKITDRLGKKIDQHIKEAIIALNISGIRTSGSCEGHLNRGIAGHWIDIEPEENVEMKALREQIKALNE